MKTFSELIHQLESVSPIEIIATIAVGVLFASVALLYEIQTTTLQRYLAPDPQITTTPLATRLILSPISIEMIENFTKKHTELAAVGVISVDMSNNTRINVFRVYNDVKLKHVVDTLDGGKLSHVESPLFNSDPTNNAEISSLLAGEYSCSSGEHSLFVQTFDTNRLIQTTCRIPIPPFYGRLTGYLVLHSSQLLSIYQVDDLKASSLRLAIDLYYTDIVKPIKSTQIMSR